MRVLVRQFLALAVALTFGLVSTAALSLEVWFVRHAESEFNVVDGPLPVPDDGVSYPLTQQGVRQAAALSASFVGVSVDYLYSSTRLRTLQTADAISFQTGLPVRLAPELVEISFGEAPDLSKDAFPILYEWKAGNADARASDGGESLYDLRARFLPFWDELLERHSYENGLLIIVTHGGVLAFMLPELCDEVSTDYTMANLVGNAGIVRTIVEDGQLTCIDWSGDQLVERSK